jgi:HEAT repeat protein
MHIRHTLALALLAVAVAAFGCSRATPTLAGGKPVNHWIEALQSPDAATRKHAVAKLGNVGPADPAAFPALLGALKDRDAGVRREAILAVMKCGPDAKDAVRVLTDLRENDRDSKVREYAAKALACHAGIEKP